MPNQDKGGPGKAGTIEPIIPAKSNKAANTAKKMSIFYFNID